MDGGRCKCCGQQVERADAVRRSLESLAIGAASRQGKRGCKGMMSLARLDPRPRDPRKRLDAVKPRREILTEWKGVLLMANTRNVICRIADVKCRPAPPLPLPPRIQLDQDFLKLDHAEHQACLGLPFFKLCKERFLYHPDSEWSKFLDFMYKSKKVAIVMCEGWQLILQPPSEGPPSGFSSIHVHYRRMADPSTILAKCVDPEETELINYHVPSFQEWVANPSSSGAAMEVESQEVPQLMKQVCNKGTYVPSTGELPKRLSDQIAKLSCQPKLKRSRVEGSLHGFGNKGTDAPNCTKEKDSQEMFSTATETLKDISNGGTGAAPSNGDVLKLPSEESLWLKEYSAEVPMPKPPSCAGDSCALEERLQPIVSFEGFSNRVNDAPSKDHTLELPVPWKFKGLSNGVSVAAFEKELCKGPPYHCSASDMVALQKSSQAMEKHKAVSNDVKAFKDEVPKPPSNGNANIVQQSLQVADQFKGASSGVRAPSEEQVPKPSSNGNGNIVQRQKTPQVVEKFKDLSNGGTGAQSSEQVPKPPSSATGTFPKHKCLPLATKLQGVSNGVDTIVMHKCPQVANKCTSFNNEAKEPKPKPPSSSIDNSAHQKTCKVVEKLKGYSNVVTDVPSSGNDMDSQQKCTQATGKFEAKFSNGVIRSKPQKIKLKKGNIGDIIKNKGNTSTDSKKGKNVYTTRWQRVIQNILQLMYLAEDRNATRVDVDVKELYWPSKKRNVVSVTIADDGKGMSSKELNGLFDLKLKDIQADYLLLTQQEKAQLVGFISRDFITSRKDFGDERLKHFKDTKHYNMLMKWLADKVHEDYDNLDIVKNGRMEEHNICNTSSKVDLYEKIPKVVGNGKSSNHAPRSHSQLPKLVGHGSSSDPAARTQSQKQVSRDDVHGKRHTSKFGLSNRLPEYLGEGIVQVHSKTSTHDSMVSSKKHELRDFPMGRTSDLKGVTPVLLHFPKNLKIGESSNSNPLIRCENCQQLRKLPYGANIDGISAEWNCNMLPYNGSCTFPAEEVAMDVDDARAPAVAEDYENEDSSEEYEVEEILDSKMILDEIHYLIRWVGYDISESTWEPSSNLLNAPAILQEFFTRFPSKQLLE